ncbi:MAG: VanZ family protein [Spongiibacteraceae bacterium]
MLLSWLDKRIARIGLAIALIAITTLSLMPSQSVPAGSGWDKFDHWAAFFTLSLLGCNAYPQRPFWQITLALLGYGIGIEIAQYFTPDRYSEALDVVADSIGILIYGVCIVLNNSLARARISTE